MMRRKLCPGLSGMVLFVSFSAVAVSQVSEKEDFDTYHLRIDAGWFYSNPSGNIQGSNDTGSIDLNKDLGFNSYPTFSGKVDWKFTRKNHLYVTIIPLDTSRQTVLNRTFTFQGQTFTAGVTADSSLDTLAVAPGYQYDFIRRKRGPSRPRITVGPVRHNGQNQCCCAGNRWWCPPECGVGLWITACTDPCRGT